MESNTKQIIRKVKKNLFAWILVAITVLIGGVSVLTARLIQGGAIPFTSPFAWNCSSYNFLVDQDGVVSVVNDSKRNERSQYARVYINDVLVVTYYVPYLKVGKSATLGTVAVPQDGFSWRVDGTKDCSDSGTYPGDIQACSLNLQISIATPTPTSGTLVCPLAPKAGRVIISLNTSMVGKILANGSLAAATYGPVATNILPGNYKVTLVSYDDHSSYNPPPYQPQEQWYLITNTTENTGTISDIPDTQDWLTEEVNQSFPVLSTITSVSARNAAYFNSNVNSVTPICAAFDLIDSSAQSTPTKLVGTTFGASPSWTSGREYDKAWDSVTSTYYDYANANGGYTGIDLGTSTKVVKTIKYYPRSGYLSRMVGGKFQGSNTSTTSGFVDLHTISSTPALNWVTVNLTNNNAYRYIRYLGPSGSYGNVAEIELWGTGSGGGITTTPIPTPTSTSAPTPTPVVSSSCQYGPYAVPGKVEAENYTCGGSNIGYYDTTIGNSGFSYRAENVDIQRTGDNSGNYNVGWMRKGEWLNYMLNVTSEGTYRLSFRVASPNTTGKFQVFIDGASVSGIKSVPNTGNWQKYTNIDITGVNLTTGQHTLRFKVERDGFNFNYMDFIKL